MPHGKLSKEERGGGSFPLKDNLANRSHMFSFVLLWPVSGFKFYYPGAFAPNEIFFVA